MREVIEMSRRRLVHGTAVFSVFALAVGALAGVSLGYSAMGTAVNAVVVCALVAVSLPRFYPASRLAVLPDRCEVSVSRYAGHYLWEDVLGVRPLRGFRRIVLGRGWWLPLARPYPLISVGRTRMRRGGVIVAADLADAPAHAAQHLSHVVAGWSGSTL